MRTDEARAYLIDAERGGLVFAHVVAGVNAGLFEAIARRGEPGVLPGDLAAELNYQADYVRVWCETAYAYRLLEDAGGGRFRFEPGFEALLTAGQPGSMVGYLRVREVFVRERFEHPEFMRTGSVRTYEEHGEQFSRAVADLTGGRADLVVEGVYKRIAEVARRLRPGARVLEVGCGTARLLPALARAFPETTYVGIDADSHAIQAGQREIEAAGLAPRISLERTRAEHMSYHEEFDLVSLYAVMHEIVPEARAEAVEKMWQALRPGGLLVSTDQFYPSRLEDFRSKEYYLAMADQAAEVVWGHRHLPRERLAELFRACGFQRSEFELFHLPGQASPRLVALAFM